MAHKQKTPPKPLNALEPPIGMRIGIAVGGLSGATLALLTAPSAWMIIFGGILGGAIGYAQAHKPMPGPSGN